MNSSSAAAAFCDISVIYVQTIPVVRRCRVNEGACVKDAIEQSGILRQCREIDLSALKVGIFGKLVKLDTVLRNGDRVEIYRKITRTLDEDDEET